MEPPVAVCAAAEEAERLGEAGAFWGRYRSWRFPLRGAVRRTTPLTAKSFNWCCPVWRAGPESGPIGGAAFTDRYAAEQWALDKRHCTGCHVISLRIGWRRHGF